MNRQSQDPNAAKPNQTTGSATQSNSTTEQSNASIRSQAGVQVSAQQRTSIRQSVVSARNAPRVDHVSFSIHTGTVVPRDVHIVSVTTFPVLIEAFPRYRDYSFFVVEDEVVFVDTNHKIVDVVPVGGGAHIGSSSTSTTVAVDLSEPEIREVQTVLIRRGYLHARADGVWGPETREALVAFQRKEGFEASGRIDTRTVSALGLQGKVSVKSDSQSSSSSSQSNGQSTTGQGMSQGQAQKNGAQKPDEKSTTGQAAPSQSQKNAAPDMGPSERMSSNDRAKPTPNDQRSSAPSRSTTGQGSADKTPQSGMSDQNSSSQPPAASGQNEKRRQ
jgi:peptidoglycan hydrolase-like protein with peptidoglycan-binding domain